MIAPYSAEQLIETDRIKIRLSALNDCSPEIAHGHLMRCCGSSTWAHLMTKARPFSTITELEDAADRAWAACSQEDWLEAFSAHPRIGQQSSNHWSRQEQSGVVSAPPEIRAALAEANRRYEAKFGYIFILCATDRTAEEALEMLQERLRNTPQAEIQNAAGQQRLITRLRLRKLLDE